MKGYKVFGSDWTCRGFQFEVGKVFEEKGAPKCCNNGFHFCTKLVNCFDYYSFDSNNKVAEIDAIGDIDSESNENKCCTNKIHIIREVSWEEVLKLVNSGDYNSGDRNSGNYNSGDRNSGNYNSGYRNSGDRNSGDRNSGDYNSGDYNSGNYNSGDCNSGYRNSGNYNSGDYNDTNHSNGCFNTSEQKIMMFNKPSEWTYRDWRNSEAGHLLNQIPRDVLEWVYSEDMTDEEKENYPEHETTGGYLKIFEKSDCAQIWWDGLLETKKDVIKNLPNFDAEIFKNITGIEI